MTTPTIPTPKADTISPADFEHFRRHGYLVLPDAITEADTSRLLAIFDRDYKTYSYLWRPFGPQIINCDSLASSPDIDYAIRHPRLLPIVEDLMGGPIVFSEICLRYMEPHAGATQQSWHRDRPHWADHPLRMDYIQLAIYLTDVSEQSHCLSISPESSDDAILPLPEQLAQRGIHDLHGPAGTAILFNISALHTATVRNTSIERKTIQTYYGHQSRPYLSNDSFVPAAFWSSTVDSKTRAFYGKLNEKTRLNRRRLRFRRTGRTGWLMPAGIGVASLFCSAAAPIAYRLYVLNVRCVLLSRLRVGSNLAQVRNIKQKATAFQSRSGHACFDCSVIATIAPTVVGSPAGGILSAPGLGEF